MTVFEDIYGNRIVHTCNSFKYAEKRNQMLSPQRMGEKRSLSIEGKVTEAWELSNPSTLQTKDYDVFDCYEKDLIMITLGIALLFSLIINVVTVIVCRQRKGKHTDHVYSGISLQRPTESDCPRPSISEVYSELVQCGQPEHSPKPGNTYLDTRLINSPVYDTAGNEYFEIGKVKREVVSSPRNEYLELIPFFQENTQEPNETPKLGPV